MPKDLFRGKSMPQTSIYVFRVKEKHPDNFKVRFIDFSNDGYKRSGRKKAKASKKLKDGGQAEARYEEVVNLVMNGASDLRLLTHDEFKEDAIALSGDRYGRDWNFTQHRHKYGSSSHADTYDIVESYQEWQVSNMSKNDVNIEDYTDTLERMRESFSLKGGKWEKKAVKEMFNVGNTVGVQNGGGIFDKLTPVVTNSAKNNGITRYELAEPTEEAGIITYSDTTSTDAIFYQPKPFIGFSHVKKMTPIRREKWTENCCLFFISNLRHEIEGQFDYDHKLNVMPEIKVPMPIIDNDIAFDFMEQYIHEVKRIHLRVLNDRFEQKKSKCQTIVKTEEKNGTKT